MICKVRSPLRVKGKDGYPVFIGTHTAICKGETESDVKAAARRQAIVEGETATIRPDEQYATHLTAH